MQTIGDIRNTDNIEQLYVAVRAHEQRIYTDEELRGLPEISKTHPHYNEWQLRKRSFQRFSRYLGKRGRTTSLSILDIGCGNGWMSNRLYREGHNVTGVDTNKSELLQAERVFGSTESLQWVYGDIFDEGFSSKQFDIIVLAAACQYFPDIKVLTARLKSMLVPGGEIHLLDSRFYGDGELKAARQRSVDYYFTLGFSHMSLHYFHHSKATLKELGYRKLYPASIELFNSNPPLEWWGLRC